MYKLSLIQGYSNLSFQSQDEDWLKHFMFQALKCALPDEESGEALQVRIEKCAEGGNPETAHNENQFNHTED